MQLILKMIIMSCILTQHTMNTNVKEYIYIASSPSLSEQNLYRFCRTKHHPDTIKLPSELKVYTYFQCINGPETMKSIQTKLKKYNSIKPGYVKIEYDELVKECQIITDFNIAETINIEQVIEDEDKKDLRKFYSDVCIDDIL